MDYSKFGQMYKLPPRIYHRPTAPLNGKKAMKKFIKDNFASVLTEKGYISRRGGIEWITLTEDKKVIKYIYFRERYRDFSVYYYAQPIYAPLPFKKYGLEACYMISGDAVNRRRFDMHKSIVSYYEYTPNPLEFGKEMYEWKLDHIYSQINYCAFPFLDAVHDCQSLYDEAKKQFYLQSDLKSSMLQCLNFYYGEREAFLSNLSYLKYTEKKIEALSPITDPFQSQFTRAAEALLLSFRNNDFSIYDKHIKECEEYNNAYMKTLFPKLYK